MEEGYISEYEAVEYAASLGFKVSVHKLRKDRANNKGIPYYKPELRVLYKKSDIDSYLEDSKIIPKGR